MVLSWRGGQRVAGGTPCRAPLTRAAGELGQRPPSLSEREAGVPRRPQPLGQQRVPLHPQGLDPAPHGTVFELIEVREDPGPDIDTSSSLISWKSCSRCWRSPSSEAPNPDLHSPGSGFRVSGWDPWGAARAATAGPCRPGRAPVSVGGCPRRPQSRARSSLRRPAPGGGGCWAPRAWAPSAVGASACVACRPWIPRRHDARSRSSCQGPSSVAWSIDDAETAGYPPEQERTPQSCTLSSGPLPVPRRQ